MAAKKKTKNLTCIDCGTEIRSAALFCYHCGSSVATETEAETKKASKSGTLLRKSMIEDKNNSNVVEIELEIKNKVAEEADDSGALKPEITDEKSGSNGNRNRKLRSAASIRNRTRKLDPKKIEIYWEEHENAPNAWFIGVSILLAAFALFVVFAAMYLK